jgi:flavin reductase (DIM6/NTAB) family NADH-FMN oxidoreductase RutF
MEITPSALPHASLYKILSGSILPRPIGWISTIDENGRPNLAPFSFFNVVCSNPPTILFCPMIRSINGGRKDTYRNIRANGEFVVNIVTEELAAAMNATSIEAPPEFGEFDFAKLTPAASVIVKPPRVAESPIHFECKESHIIDINDQPGGGSVVIGEVVHIHLAERVMIGSDKIDLSVLKPIGRLVGNLYARATDTFELERPKPLIAKL